jgi:hypothetical protein
MNFVLFPILFSLFFFSCVEKKVNKKKEVSAALTSSSLPPLELNCPGGEANDCLGTPGVLAGDAANKRVRVIWMKDTSCAARGTSQAHIAQSDLFTTDVGGTNVQYISTYTYSNFETTIDSGNYALWVFIDTSNNGLLEQNEPIVCRDVSISGEVGAIAITGGWRNASLSDQTTLQ